jgi:N-acetylmuramoyl-L-alanine amidase
MLSMDSAACGVGVSRKIPHLLLTILVFVGPVQASRWDSQAAAEAFDSATQKQIALSQDAAPSLGKYLECVREFRKVYLRDPHFRRVGDAIYQEGLLYQQMGDRFGDQQHYKTAVKRFELLVNDYGGNQNCPEALVHLIEIYSRHLNNESAAQNAYRLLKTQYPYSKEAIKQAQLPQIETPPPTPQLERPLPSPPQERSGESRSSLQSVRFWSESDHTRVMIDFDLETAYTHARISGPDRLYLDIPKVRLSDDLRNRTFQVADQRLNQIRVGQNRSDLVRVVLDLAGRCSYSLSEMHAPFRIVIDLRGEPAAVRESKIAPPEANPPPAAKTSRPGNTEAVELATKPEAKKITASPQTAESQVPASSKPVQPAVAVTEKRQPSTRLEGESRPPAAAAPQQRPPAAVALTEPAKAAPLPTVMAKEPEAAKAGQKPGLAGPLESNPQMSSGSATQDRSLAAKDSKQAPPPVSTASVSVKPPKSPETAATPKPAAPTSHGDRTLTRELGLKIGRVVLDPGHGGHDRGTIGPGGLCEKDLVLALARKLQKLLEEKLGAEVFLTRNDDTFISLEERTAIANEHHADLFISIHANSSRIRSISGVETYFLDFARTESEREIAARENATTLSNVRDLEDLIKKIAQADRSLESRELASIIQKKLYAGARQLSPATQNRGVRSAPFVVLIGANMPSILAEVAFISNPKDERLLSRDANQELLAKALFSGIEGYMKTLGSDVTKNRQAQSK